jgi:hypothetical protein
VGLLSDKIGDYFEVLAEQREEVSQIFIFRLKGAVPEFKAGTQFPPLPGCISFCSIVILHPQPPKRPPKQHHGLQDTAIPSCLQSTSSKPQFAILPSDLHHGQRT